MLRNGKQEINLRETWFLSASTDALTGMSSVDSFEKRVQTDNSAVHMIYVWARN